MGIKFEAAPYVCEPDLSKWGTSVRPLNVILRCKFDPIIDPMLKRIRFEVPHEDYEQGHIAGFEYLTYASVKIGPITAKLDEFSGILDVDRLLEEYDEKREDYKDIENILDSYKDHIEKELDAFLETIEVDGIEGIFL